MGGAVIGPETTILPLSLVLKEMHLPTAYEGSPAEPVRMLEARCARTISWVDGVLPARGASTPPISKGVQ